MEIKGTTLNTDICKKTAEILDRYKGAYCIESFNPYYVRWFKNNRPDVVRGQLACRMEPGQTLKESARNFLLENMMLNFLSRPQFLAYCHADCQKLSFRLARQMGGYPVAWTITQPAELSEARTDFKAFIFEGFLPEAKK